MSAKNENEIAPGIFWVGVEDWHRRIGYALFRFPYGSSYNAYLVVGNNKVALVDTVYAAFEDDLLRKIERIKDPESIDYIIMNHAEPDHASAIPRIMSIAKNAKLIVTKIGVDMAKAFYDVPPEKTIIVKDGDTLDLGGKTLRFIEAPWLHWPETMFTYCVEGKVLFPCDFFGTHMAKSKLYDDEVCDMLLPEAKKYFATVLKPYPLSINRALDKVKNLNINLIAPSHGPIYRNPKRILEAYEKWARGPLQPKVVVVYVTMWGETEALEKTIVDSISAEGLETVPYNLLDVDIAHVLRDFLDASAIVIGSPTFVNGAHPLAAKVTELIRAYKPRAKLVSIFGSYGWGRGAVTQIKDKLQQSGFEIVDTLEVRGKPKKEDLEKAIGLGKHIAVRIKESLKA